MKKLLVVCCIAIVVFLLSIIQMSPGEVTNYNQKNNKTYSDKFSFEEHFIGCVTYRGKLSNGLMEIGDFDDDGDNDIVFINDGGGITILENKKIR